MTWVVKQRINDAVRLVVHVTSLRVYEAVELDRITEGEATASDDNLRLTILEEILLALYFDGEDCVIIQGQTITTCGVDCYTRYAAVTQAVISSRVVCLRVYSSSVQ